MKDTKRKPSNFRYGRETDIAMDIWGDLLRYPPFATHRGVGGMRITHHMSDGGTVVAEAPDAVTTADAVRVFAAIHLGRNPISAQIRGTLITSVKFHVKEVRKLTGSNDDRANIKSLFGAAKLCLTHERPGRRETTKLIHDVCYDEASGEIEVTFNGYFYAACRSQTEALTLNLTLYMCLTPIARNIYTFIATNSRRQGFLQSTINERGGITAKRSGKRREKLLAALQELAGKGVIKGFAEGCSVNGARTIEIERYRITARENEA